MRVKTNILAVLLGLSLFSLPAQAAKVYVDFEGIVTQIRQNTLPPGVTIGEKITGYYVVNTDQAPTDTDPLDPHLGDYLDRDESPAPGTFIEATVIVGGRTFKSKFDRTILGQEVIIRDGDTDLYEIYEATASAGKGFDLWIYFKSERTELDDMVIGDSIEQDIDWSIEPFNTLPNEGQFGFNEDVNEVQLYFDLTRFKVGLTPLPVTPLVVASVLPSSRSVQVADPATAFAIIINAGSTTATDCSIAPLTSVQADFSYQTTSASNTLIGTPNTPVDIAAGASQNYLFVFTPAASFTPVDVQLAFDCSNTDPATITLGLNTLLLVADSNPVPDIVALGATPTGDGIVDLASTGVFSVATANVGSAGTIAVSADTGSATLPVSIALCETNPATGVCVNPTVPTLGSVTTSIAADATPTFAFFVTGTDTVPFDPANNRVFVRFKDAGGVTRGSTSVAVRTL